jgi:hypothetical protein
MLNKLLKILLGQGPRALTHYCMRVHAGSPTTTRVYLTKHKNRKVADGTKNDPDYFRHEMRAEI